MSDKKRSYTKGTKPVSATAKKTSAAGSTIKVNTDKVRTTVNKIDKLNNDLDRDFKSVIDAIGKLGNNWESSASSKVISEFYKMKSELCGSSGRSAVMKNYLQFLCDSVAIGYENTETSNTQLSDLFK